MFKFILEFPSNSHLWSVDIYSFVQNGNRLFEIQLTLHHVEAVMTF